jgi:hypothetical protein
MCEFLVVSSGIIFTQISTVSVFRVSSRCQLLCCVKIELHTRGNSLEEYRGTRSVKWHTEHVLLEEDEICGD